MRKWISPDQARPVQDWQSVVRSSPTFPLDRTGLSPTADRDRLDWCNHCIQRSFGSSSRARWQLSNPGNLKYRHWRIWTRRLAAAMALCPSFSRRRAKADWWGRNWIWPAETQWPGEGQIGLYSHGCSDCSSEYGYGWMEEGQFNVKSHYAGHRVVPGFRKRSVIPRPHGVWASGYSTSQADPVAGRQA